MGTEMIHEGSLSLNPSNLSGRLFTTHLVAFHALPLFRATSGKLNAT
jgi:hypothetical protein